MNQTLLSTLLSFPLLATPPPATTFYGQVELDATHDSNLTDLGQPETRGTENRRWDLSAAPSRLGATFTAAGPWGATLSGKLEGDFQGLGGSANLRLRHGYVRLDWASGFSLLAGQTDDFAAPLQVDTISYPLESLTGDLGRRRPQLQATQVLGSGPHRWTLQVGLGTTRVETAKPVDGGDRQATLPIALGRIAWTLAPPEGIGLTLGLYGHTGDGEFRFDALGSGERVRTWSGGLDLTVNFGPHWTLLAEAWRGTTVDLQREAAPALLLTQQRHGLRMTGGWATLTWKVLPTLRFNLGTGLERTLAEDVPTDGRERVQTHMLNVFFDPAPKLELGLELSVWRASAFRAQPALEKTRLQACVIYTF